jgi:hypothetical protein
MKRSEEHASHRPVHWFRTNPSVAANAAAPAAISARLKRLGLTDSRAQAGRRHARTSAHTRAVAATACSKSKINVSHGDHVSCSRNPFSRLAKIRTQQRTASVGQEEGAGSKEEPRDGGRLGLQSV